MSRTVRYFKLMYIVTGILLSNAAICETVDQIQIAPRLCQNAETKDKLKQPARKCVQKTLQISEKKNAISKRWYHKFYIFRLLHKLQNTLSWHWRLFSVWTLFNLFIECSTRLLCRTFVISSDCDVIYK